MQTVTFEDHAQDFVQWDIKGGKVVGCRPFQKEVWVGTVVHNDTIKPGDCLYVTTPLGVNRTMRYKVAAVEDTRDCRACNHHKSLSNKAKGVRIPCSFGKCTRPGGHCNPHRTNKW